MAGSVGAYHVTGQVTKWLIGVGSGGVCCDSVGWGLAACIVASRTGAELAGLVPDDVLGD